MNTLNPRHPEFVLAMEIALSIPPEPAGVPLQDLADDFGLACQDRAIDHLDEFFGAAAYLVFPRSHRHHQRWISIARHRWEVMSIMLQRYWERTNHCPLADHDSPNVPHHG